MCMCVCMYMCMYMFRFLPTEGVTRCTKDITQYSTFVCLFITKGKQVINLENKQCNVSLLMSITQTSPAFIKIQIYNNNNS